VATAGFDELNVNVAATAVPAEFTADGRSVITWPATNEAVFGLRFTWATVVLTFLLLPQLASSSATITGMRQAPAVRPNRPFGRNDPGRYRLRLVGINIRREFSVDFCANFFKESSPWQLVLAGCPVRKQNGSLKGDKPEDRLTLLVLWD
jgi:hypothetical protein